MKLYANNVCSSTGEMRWKHELTEGSPLPYVQWRARAAVPSLKNGTNRFDNGRWPPANRFRRKGRGTHWRERPPLRVLLPLTWRKNELHKTRRVADTPSARLSFF